MGALSHACALAPALHLGTEGLSDRPASLWRGTRQPEARTRCQARRSDSRGRSDTLIMRELWEDSFSAKWAR